MNKKPISILLYGPDQSKLEVRRHVLNAIGHQVWIATNLLDVCNIVSNVPRLDLLVLSHSFSKQECGRAIALAHSRWPSTRTCLLSAANSTTSSAEVTVEVMDALRGPARLGSQFEILVANESSSCSHLY
jgi:PleD family two-component response regulator